MNDLISVIVPVYNVENYLDECLVSIINQTYKNLEIILCNDGSTDSSLEICKKYQDLDERVKLINKKNGGLSDARNKGIENSSGKYITFIDSDDYINPNMISYLYENLKANNTEIACCQRQEVDDSSNYLKIKDINYNSFVVKGNYECMQEFLKFDRINTVAWGKLYDRHLFDNIIFPVGKYHEDVFTTYKTISKCNSIFVGIEKYYYYRIRKGSIINSNFNFKHFDSIDANVERTKFINLNYPSLASEAKVGIIYSSNQILMRLMKDKHVDINSCEVKEKINQIQEYYRKYESDFLKGNSSVLSKLFSIFSYFNARFFIFLMRGIYSYFS